MPGQGLRWDTAHPCLAERLLLVPSTHSRGLGCVSRVWSVALPFCTSFAFQQHGLCPSWVCPAMPPPCDFPHLTCAPQMVSCALLPSTLPGDGAHHLSSDRDLRGVHLDRDLGDLAKRHILLGRPPVLLKGLGTWAGRRGLPGWGWVLRQAAGVVLRSTPLLADSSVAGQGSASWLLGAGPMVITAAATWLGPSQACSAPVPRAMTLSLVVLTPRLFGLPLPEEQQSGEDDTIYFFMEMSREHDFYQGKMLHVARLLGTALGPGWVETAPMGLGEAA